MAQLSRRFYLMMISKCSPTTLKRHAAQVWAIPFSLATTQGITICFLFLPVLRCFSSRGWLSYEYYTFSIVGFPIRRSRDIMLVCSSPWLIAAYHVLRRLSDPRHPPCALNCFKKIKKLEFVILVVVTRPHFFRPTKKWCDCQNNDRIVRYSSNIYFPICQRADSPKANKQMCWT
jgi:hypothetical protein